MAWISTDDVGEVVYHALVNQPTADADRDLLLYGAELLSYDEVRPQFHVPRVPHPF